MEPMCQQVNDPAIFEAPDSGAAEASPLELNQPPSLDSEMMDALNLHKTNVDNKMSQQLSTNALVDARTMLKSEDRQDIMLDMDKSLAYQEDEESL